MGLLYERAVSQGGLETDNDILAFLWPTISPLACFQDFLLQHTVTCGGDTLNDTQCKKGSGEGLLVPSI